MFPTVPVPKLKPRPDEKVEPWEPTSKASAKLFLFNFKNICLYLVELKRFPKLKKYRKENLLVNIFFKGLC
jgi:hypothetical protein